MHRLDRRVERDRELAYDRLLVQRAHAVERGEALAGVGGALEHELTELTEPAPPQPGEVDDAAERVKRLRGADVVVAFSRRMCCSRVCSVSTKPRRPSTSVVWPAMRPGMRRR